ncbi:cytochrome c oxidase subunit II [Hydrogenophaga laconesensis]|uniref:cytochrome c oxidase subunit II n=1 Tax=Hydrogenophaga laconesensis TaxID=1805971 RepID=UPI00286C9B04|nr:cytochrome c oxidase subunit II [Hydrogenophaga laconesensis]
MPMLSGCAGAQSMLDPAGPSARAIALVWWWMLGVAVLVTLGVVLAWLLAMRRGSGPEGVATEAHAARHGQRWIVGGGIVLPSLAIAALLLFGTPAGLHQLPLPASWSGGGAQGVAPLRVDVTARQWAWALQYPDSGVRLQNELRMPVGRPVDIHVGSDDVIHSFWVPRLGGKIDAIPGRINVVRLQADVPGTFRGQCAEFCGLNHAHMVMAVIAMPADEFDAWLAAQPREGAR